MCICREGFLVVCVFELQPFELTSWPRSFHFVGGRFCVIRGVCRWIGKKLVQEVVATYTNTRPIYAPTNDSGSGLVWRCISAPLACGMPLHMSLVADHKWGRGKTYFWASEQKIGIVDAKAHIQYVPKNCKHTIKRGEKIFGRRIHSADYYLCTRKPDVWIRLQNKPVKSKENVYNRITRARKTHSRPQKRCRYGVVVV